MRNICFRGDIAVYVLMLLGMSIGLYLMGFTSTVLGSISTSGQVNAETLIDEIIGGVIGAFSNLGISLPMIGFGLLAGIGGGYSRGTILSFMIPVMMLFAVANIFLFPVIPTIEAEAHMSPQMNVITMLLSLIFNVMLFLAVLEYSSGRK